MCGIAGIYAFDADMQIPETRIDAMVSRLEHRGPDDKGVWRGHGVVLGHTRLAILDLSSAGHQPMSSQNGRLVITFNGEIYNFRELRAELESLGCRFSTATDTEVLLAAWIQWGEACVHRLDGIFAFSLYDRELHKLFLVRDPLGIKPLFYRKCADQLLFSSELLPLAARELPQPEIKLEDIDSYFTFNYLVAPKTGLKDFCQLPGGHILVADGRRIDISCYWKPHYINELPEYSRELTENFFSLLDENVKRQMVSDAPLGLFLSGGLDSYAVSHSAVSQGRAPTAFTLGFESRNHDETPAAADYANYLKIPHSPVVFRWDEGEIRNTLAVMGELLADASCFPIHQLSRHARKYATVILAGDGADELLAGYDTYKAGEVTPYVRALPLWFIDTIKSLVSVLPSDNQRYGKRMVLERMLAAAVSGHKRDHASFRRIFWDDDKKELYDPDFLNSVKSFDPVSEYASLMDEVPVNRSYLTARQHADILFHLPSILAKVDRMSMACGLEVRVPFLAPALVSFCLNLPDSAKRHKGKGKRILRDAVAPYIPSEALKRPKAGFLPPVDRWFRHDMEMKSVFNGFLDEAKSLHLPLLRWDKVESFWKKHQSGEVEAGFVLLSILQYINWSLKCRR